MDAQTANTPQNSNVAQNRAERARSGALMPGRGTPLRGRRRAVALMLVMIAVIVAGTVGYSYLSAQETAVALARNIDDAAKARYVAESGMEIALSFIRTNSNWRTAVSNGTWASNVSLAGGTYTIRGEDGIDANNDGVITIPTEGDGSLSDNTGDPVTLTVTAVVGGASSKVTAVTGSAGGGGAQYGYKSVSPLSQDDLDGMQIACRVSIGTGGALKSISYYGGGPTSKDYRLALYTDSHGEPGALVAQTAVTRLGSNAAAWRTAAVIGTPPNVSAGDYWIAVGVEHKQMDVYYGSVGEIRFKSGDVIDGSYSSSWGSSISSLPAALNAYVTIDSSGVSIDWKN
jgi:hypothetical protein